MKWQGLDTAGVEFLWQEDVLTGVLRIFNQHEPVAHSDPDSPIYTDLADSFGNYTWFNGDGRDFRPIFRRAHPLMKIGLVEGDYRETRLTDLGKELIAGETSFSEIFQSTLAIFAEPDGTRSFAQMCRAGLLLQNHEFRLEDIEFAVSEMGDDLDELPAKIAEVRQKGFRVSSAQRRSRKLRSFMTALVNAGAFAPTEKGWRLHNIDAALQISGLGIEGVDALQLDEDDGLIHRDLKALKTREIQEGARVPPKINAKEASKLSPEQRALLLEKAHSEHERIIELAAADIRAEGGVPIECLGSFDVGCLAPVKLLFEAKHIHKKNAISQLRKAIAQLPEYRWKHKKEYGDESKLIIGRSADPRPFAGEDYLDFIEQDRNMPVIWRDGDRLLDRQGQSFRDHLTQP